MSETNIFRIHFPTNTYLGCTARYSRRHKRRHIIHRRRQPQSTLHTTRICGKSNSIIISKIRMSFSRIVIAIHCCTTELGDAKIRTEKRTNYPILSHRLLRHCVWGSDGTKFVLNVLPFSTFIYIEVCI